MIDAMLGPMLKVAAVRIRADVQARGVEVVAAEYAATLTTLVGQLPPADRQLVERVLELVQLSGAARV